MPRYRFYNPTLHLIRIPGVGVWIKPRTHLTLDVRAVLLDNEPLNVLVEGGHLRLAPVVESPLINDGLEIPVVDMLGSGGGSLPPATEIGQVLFAEDGVAFTPELPITGPFGWLRNDDGILIIVG